MTDLLLNHPVAMFFLGLGILAGVITWVLYLIVQAYERHLEWKDSQRQLIHPRTWSRVPIHAADSPRKAVRPQGRIH